MYFYFGSLSFIYSGLCLSGSPSRPNTIFRYVKRNSFLNATLQILTAIFVLFMSSNICFVSE